MQFEKNQGLYISEIEKYRIKIVAQEQDIKERTAYIGAINFKFKELQQSTKITISDLSNSVSRLQQENY
jgi:DNA-binding MarR family transcriptional regulator